MIHLRQDNLKDETLAENNKELRGSWIVVSSTSLPNDREELLQVILLNMAGKQLNVLALHLP